MWVTQMENSKRGSICSSVFCFWRLQEKIIQSASLLQSLCRLPSFICCSGKIAGCCINSSRDRQEKWEQNERRKPFRSWTWFLSNTGKCQHPALCQQDERQISILINLFIGWATGALDTNDYSSKIPQLSCINHFSFCSSLSPVSI